MASISSFAFLRKELLRRSVNPIQSCESRSDEGQTGMRRTEGCSIERLRLKVGGEEIKQGTQVVLLLRPLLEELKREKQRGA